VHREETKSYIEKGRKRYRCRPQTPPPHRCFATAHSVCNESFPKTGYSPHTTHLSLFLSLSLSLVQPNQPPQHFVIHSSNPNTIS